MGCGASKGTEGTPVTLPPSAPTPEFSPETKPRPTTGPNNIANAKESPEATNKRVDAIVKGGIADFDDGVVTTPVKPLTEDDSVQLFTAASLPPPPVTPPAAAKKPLFQTADTNNFGDASGAEAPFFPTQVTLNVGGAGYSQQQQEPVPLRTSLHAFDDNNSNYGNNNSRRSSVIELPPASGAAASTTLITSTSSRQLQLQPLPQQLQPLQGSALQPLSSQGQPLTESGPGPGATSATAATQSHGGAEASGDDPWSSLQSTYRIREPQSAAKSDSTRSRVAGSSRDTGHEVLVLGDDDDDDFSRGGGALNATGNSAMNRTSGFGGRPPISLPPPKFASAPKQGGWGSGAMAQAGELMIGEDDWLVNDRPPGVGTGSGRIPPPQQQQQLRQPQQQQAAVMSYNSRAKLAVEEEQRHPPVTLKGPKPPPKAKAPEDVMCEDVEDVDTLLEDEMERQGLSSKSLANKLAAYEAQFKDEND